MKQKRKFLWKQFGKDLAEWLESSGKSMRAFAGDLGVHHATFHRAMNGRPIQVPDFAYLVTKMPKAKLTDYLPEGRA